MAPSVGVCFGRESGGGGAGGGGKPCPEAGMRSRLLLPGLLTPVQQPLVAFQKAYEWLTEIGCFYKPKEPLDRKSYAELFQTLWQLLSKSFVTLNAPFKPCFVLFDVKVLLVHQHNSDCIIGRHMPWKIQHQYLLVFMRLQTAVWHQEGRLFVAAEPRVSM